MVLQTKKELLCCWVFEWGARKGLEFRVACVSIIFITVKSRKFAGLICLLFAARDNVFFFSFFFLPFFYPGAKFLFDVLNSGSKSV